MGPPKSESEASAATDPDAMHELLVDQMRDLLHAEKQLTKALPKMAKAAQSEQLTALIETHLAETEEQVNRLTEGLKLLDAPMRAKPCKGMMGLVEEGEEVMKDSKKMQPAGADLALIGAAQKVEHYEMAGYMTARNLAQQMRPARSLRCFRNSGRRGERGSAAQPGGEAADVLGGCPLRSNWLTRSDVTLWCPALPGTSSISQTLP